MAVEQNTQEKPWRDRDVLEDLYIEKELSGREIAQRFGCDNVTVYRWLDRHNIPRRGTCAPDHDDTPWRNEELLRRMYVEEEMSTIEIADEWGCGTSTVTKWLHKHEIQTRTPSEAAPTGEEHPHHDGRKSTPEELKDESLLREWYGEQKLTTGEIAQCVGCSPTAVQTWLRKHGIELRSSHHPINVQRRPQNNPVAPEGVTSGEQLRHQYQDENMSMAEIGEKHGVSTQAVRYWMRKHGIGRRSFREAAPVGEDSPGWKGGYDRNYGPSWPRQRRKARKRDGYTCQRCGMPQEEHKKKQNQKLHVHHIRPFRLFEDSKEANKLQNLITLCISCHNRLEGIPIDTSSERVANDD